MMKSQSQPQGQFADINGLKLYYEIHGSGRPLVLIHGGGSTISTTFGRVLPDLAKNFEVIAVELQAHGHTADIDRPLSFEEDADDVAALLKHLKISKADFFGFSNGGTTCLQIAIRHPQIVNKLVLASSCYKRSGVQPALFEGFQDATVESMPSQLKQAYQEINSDHAGLQAMFDRDVARMLAFQDISDDAVAGIQAPVLVINGDSEGIRTEHALELANTLPNASLAIIPGGHGDYIGEICTPQDPSAKVPLTLELIKEFLA